MTSVRQFIKTAEADLPVYISVVRDAFQRDGVRPFHIHVKLYDDSTRRFPLRLPVCTDEEEKEFVEEYLNATLYNLLSASGAREICIFFETDDADLAAYVRSLNDTFQVEIPLASRTGYGKCLNVNQRILSFLCGEDVQFRFRFELIDKEYVSFTSAPAIESRPVFTKLPAIAEHGRFMGMDIGGTDIKLIASLDGKLCVFKEYDWNPSAFTQAEQVTDPLVMLTRLMRAAVCMAEAGLSDKITSSVFDRAADDAEIEAAVIAMEAQLGDKVQNFHGIGLCFPDVVIRNHVIGGESPKTQGIRNNTSLDYESELQKITGLNELLEEFVQPDGAVMNINDGSMAAFTAAVEQAGAGRSLSDGFFAHSLGTDLGTGWILPDGSIPEIPLEVYNFIIDLGSRRQRGFKTHDVRSVRNFVTDLPGTLQKYAGQSGIFRLAAKNLPDTDPDLYRRVFDNGLFQWEEECLTVPFKPRDMRKSCLEFFMDAASDTESSAAELFRKVGECLAAARQETQFILEPACTICTLFGRMVKNGSCFEEILEGAHRLVPDLQLEVADEMLASTPLMRQLAQHSVYTVAQFGQTVGAIYYACLGLLDSEIDLWRKQ